MRIVVTGGVGYIGSHTVVELLQNGYETLIIDDLSNSNIGVLDGIKKITGKEPVFAQIDCMDKEALSRFFSAHQPIDGIIHFAAKKAVGESVKEPLLYYRNNIDSLLNLLELSEEYGIKNFVFSSSCTVYGQADYLPVDEAMERKPAASPYGNTKVICEDIIMDYIHSGASLKSIILRYFNPIGAHESAEIGELPNGIPQNLIPFVTQTAIGIREKLMVFGNDYDTPDGSCIRDYIHVVDLAKAHVSALEYVMSENGKAVDVFNIGTGNGYSVLEVIDTFRQVTGVPLNYEITARREGDIEQIWADPQKANTQLGWKAYKTLEEMLLSAWKWQLKLRERENV